MKNTKEYFKPTKSMSLRAPVLSGRSNLRFVFLLRGLLRSLRFLAMTPMSVLFLIGCGAAEIKPVELFPEDECSNCRMSVSNPAFASEILSQENEVFKFDDLACLEQFRKKRNEVKIAAIFVKDYETKQWIRYENSVMIHTGIETPMGSGRIAVANSERAKALTQQFPVKDISEKMGKGCCGDEECNK